jgi:hypothetical protein
VGESRSVRPAGDAVSERELAALTLNARRGSARRPRIPRSWRRSSCGFPWAMWSVPGGDGHESAPLYGDPGPDRSPARPRRRLWDKAGSASAAGAAPPLPTS